MTDPNSTEDTVTVNESAAFTPRIVYHLHQSREMRSNEFHYVDHPALGLVVTVFPYEVPPLPESTPDPDEAEASPATPEPPQ